MFTCLDEYFAFIINKNTLSGFTSLHYTSFLESFIHLYSLQRTHKVKHLFLYWNLGVKKNWVPNAWS